MNFMDMITRSIDELLKTPAQNLTVIQIGFGVLLSYLGGIISSFTPCVYPMIPITISIVGGIEDEKTKPTFSKTFIKGFFYVLGMAAVYSFLGVLAGLTSQVFGTTTNTKTWTLFLGIVFSVASLMMMEVFTVDFSRILFQIKKVFAPSTHQKLNHEKEETTLLGAFGLGASAGLIAAPCTTPALTVILGFIAKTQSVGIGFLFMAAFSFGLGTLLLAIALFAGLLKTLPRSGSWMKTFKILSGLVLLGMAEYLIYKAGSL